MAKKRKSVSQRAEPREDKTRYDLEERFEDSEDDFYTGKEKILLEEGPATKRRRRLEDQEKDIQPSDEEVLAQDELDDQDDDFDNEDFSEAALEADSEDGDEEAWGTTKADYYNADFIETEADAIDEEKEARRLQNKQMKSMTNADFGFDETEWIQSESKKVISGPVVEKLPDASIPSGASKKDQVVILYSRYPEFSLLAKDFVDLQPVWTQLQDRATEFGDVSHEGITVRTKMNALTSYLGAIAMYFAVITSTTATNGSATRITALSPNELREHTIIDHLMATKQLWETVKEVEEVEVVERPQVVASETISLPKKVKEQNVRIKNTVGNRSKAEPIASETSSDLEDFDLPQLASKPVKKSKMLDLQSLLAQSTNPQMEDESDFGDEGPLTEQQAAEKAQKKKSLRFYTSQIAQKANKRGAASRDAGGDDDVPRKERLRDRQERLLKEAENRGRQKAVGDEQLDDESDNGDHARNGGNDNEYYESLVSQSKRKKSEKLEKAAAYAEAAKQGAQVYEEEQVGTDGKRRITYAIEKNKGLAPKRKKDVRNPRVKKRKKYDEKVKKLSSIRQVYKGGEGRGGYGGELTGIKTNIVKSVKL